MTSASKARKPRTQRKSQFPPPENWPLELGDQAVQCTTPEELQNLLKTAGPPRYVNELVSFVDSLLEAKLSKEEFDWRIQVLEPIFRKTLIQKVKMSKSKGRVSEIYGQLFFLEFTYEKEPLFPDSLLIFFDEQRIVLETRFPSLFEDDLESEMFESQHQFNLRREQIQMDACEAKAAATETKEDSSK